MKHTLRSKNLPFLTLRIAPYEYDAQKSGHNAGKWDTGATGGFWRNVLQTAANWSSCLCFPGHSEAAQLWISDNRILISDKIKVIKLLFSSHNKTNSTSQHILLKMKEKIYLAVPYKSQTTVLVNPGFWVEGSWVWGPDRDSRVTLSNRSNFGVLITNWGGGGIYLIERLWDKWNNVYGLFSKMATQ